MNLQTWFKKLERRLKQVDETAWTNEAIALLSDKALEKAGSLDAYEDTADGFKKLKEQLLGSNNKSDVAQLDKFCARRQHKGESVTQFAQVLKRLAAGLVTEEEELKNRFYAGLLSDRLRLALSEMMVERRNSALSFEELVKYAGNKEANWASHYRNYKSGVSDGSGAESASHHNNNRTANVPHNQNNRTQDSRHAQYAAPPKHPLGQPNRNNRGFPNKLRLGAATYPPQAQGSCHGCNMTGHFIKDCPNRRAAESYQAANQ